jgi:hypothetical protein
MLVFMFWDVVSVKRYPDSTYAGKPGSVKSNEIRGRFVGFSKHVGHALTFKILTDDTQKIIYRSQVRLTNTGENNFKLDILAGDPSTERHVIRSKRDVKDPNVRLPTVDGEQNPFIIFQDTSTDSAEDVSNTLLPSPPDDDLVHASNLSASLVKTVRGDDDGDPPEPPDPSKQNYDDIVP